MNKWGEMEKQIWRGMLNAGWPKTDANNVVNQVVNNAGGKSSSIDPVEVAVRCKNGKLITMERGK